MKESEKPSIFTASDLRVRHVAFLDVLGFSAKVLSDFNGTVSLYEELVSGWQIHNRVYSQVQLTIYSDSMILVSNELPPLLQAVTSLHMITMGLSCMLRGGIATGLHVSSSGGQDIYVVSEPLTRAAALEKIVRDPCVAIHESVEIPDRWWPANLPNVHRPILWYEGRRIVNPFHRYWYRSGQIRAKELRALYLDHRSKYDWFIRLYEAVGREDPLIPPELIVSGKG
jgi:hypothetical protein